jgi:hypothetical protein
VPEKLLLERVRKTMNPMQRNTHLVSALAITVVTAGYGLFEARTLVGGPQVTIESPQPGETIESALYTIEGRAENVSRVRVHGKEVALDPSGRFNETFATPRGYGVAVVDAEDRFGKTTQATVDFVGVPRGDTEPEAGAYARTN